MAADLFETYAAVPVAVMLLGIAFPAGELWLYPLALGGISILASVIGTFFARVGRGQNAIMNALYKSVIVATVLSAIGFIPVTQAFDGGVLVLEPLRSRPRRPRRHVPSRRHYGVLHRHSLEAGEGDRRGLADGPRDEHHQRARGRDAGDCGAGSRHRCRRDRGLPAW